MLTRDEQDARAERKRRGRNEPAVGERFGRWFVIAEAGFEDRSHGRVRLVRCRCDCGQEKTVLLAISEAPHLRAMLAR